MGLLCSCPAEAVLTAVPKVARPPTGSPSLRPCSRVTFLASLLQRHYPCVPAPGSPSLRRCYSVTIVRPCYRVTILASLSLPPPARPRNPAGTYPVASYVRSVTRLNLLLQVSMSKSHQRSRHQSNMYRMHSRYLNYFAHFPRRIGFCNTGIY